MPHLILVSVQTCLTGANQTQGCLRAENLCGEQRKVSTQPAVRARLASSVQVSGQVPRVSCAQHTVCHLISISGSLTEAPKPHECCCTSFALGDSMPPSYLLSGQPSAASPLPLLPGGPLGKGCSVYLAAQHSTARHSSHLCAANKCGSAVYVL